MIKIILFLFSNLANLLIIYLADNKSIEGNLRTYAISSALISFLYTFSYSKGEKELVIKSINYMVLLLVGISIAVTNLKWLVWAAYPACVVAAEFGSSQVIKNKIEMISRVTTIGALLLLLIGLNSEQVMQIRMGMASIIIIYTQILLDKNYTKLLIVNPFKYFALVYIAYTGSQMIYTRMYDGENLKIWFLVNQIGLGMYLKLLDFKTRDYGVSMPLKKLVFGVVFLLGCGAVFLTSEISGIFIYIVALILILIADSLVTKERKVK